MVGGDCRDSFEMNALGKASFASFRRRKSGGETRLANNCTPLLFVVFVLSSDGAAPDGMERNGVRFGAKHLTFRVGESG